MTTSKFPLTVEAVDVFSLLKNEMVNVTLGVIDDELPFILETDASDVAISATLIKKKKRPIAFYSRIVNSCEVRQSSVEKEASAIVEQFVTGATFCRTPFQINDRSTIGSIYV